MSTPFIYGRLARSENFTDRTAETALLVRNFSSSVNTVIISPRRWGKSSLVAKAAERATAENRELRVCILDLFNVRNETDFYELLAHNLLKATSSRWEEAVESAKTFFTGLVPKIILTGDGQNEIGLEFDHKALCANPDEVLDLAEKIAAEKDLQIVVCVDEFQNIAEFDDPLGFQKKLRAHWQQHRHVSYCLYGSKRHMMLDVFTNSSMPFYKFGDLLFLEKIETAAWLDFLTERFASTGKSITADAAEQIVALADNHPYYVQQLAQQAWLRSDKVCVGETVKTAHEALVAQLSLLFVTIVETLSSNQLKLLQAILAGETAFSSAEVLSKYGIGSSANVFRTRKALIEKDILDDRAGKLSVQDPMFRYWLATAYFNM